MELRNPSCDIVDARHNFWLSHFLLSAIGFPAVMISSLISSLRSPINFGVW